MTELMICPDGQVLAHNLTPAFAELLRELNPDDELMQERSGTERSDAERRVLINTGASARCVDPPEGRTVLTVSPVSAPEQETVETVSPSSAFVITPLKRGVNEKPEAPAAEQVTPRATQLTDHGARNTEGEQEQDCD